MHAQNVNTIYLVISFISSDLITNLSQQPYKLANERGKRRVKNSLILACMKMRKEQQAKVRLRAGSCSGFQPIFGHQVNLILPVLRPFRGTFTRDNDYQTFWRDFLPDKHMEWTVLSETRLGSNNGLFDGYSFFRCISSAFSFLSLPLPPLIIIVAVTMMIIIIMIKM